MRIDGVDTAMDGLARARGTSSSAPANRGLRLVRFPNPKVPTRNPPGSISINAELKTTGPGF